MNLKVNETLCFSDKYDFFYLTFKKNLMWSTTSEIFTLFCTKKILNNELKKTCQKQFNQFKFSDRKVWLHLREKESCSTLLAQSGCSRDLSSDNSHLLIDTNKD